MRRAERMMIHHLPNKDMSKPGCQAAQRKAAGKAAPKDCDGFIRWVDIKPTIDDMASQIEAQFGGGSS